MTDDSRPDLAQTLYLARHGQTALNAEGRLRGLANPPLDDVGITEAHRLGAALAGFRPAAVFTSPLQRAVRTGQIVAEHARVSQVSEPRLNDRDYGPWTGRIKVEVIDEWGKVDNAPGVEPLSRVLERARPFLDIALDDYPGESVVIVTHDAVIRPLIESIDPSRNGLTVPTGSWAQLQRMRGQWSVVLTDQVPDDQLIS